MPRNMFEDLQTARNFFNGRMNNMSRLEEQKAQGQVDYQNELLNALRGKTPQEIEMLKQQVAKMMFENQVAPENNEAQLAATRAGTGNVQARTEGTLEQNKWIPALNQAQLADTGSQIDLRSMQGQNMRTQADIERERLNQSASQFMQDMQRQYEAMKQQGTQFDAGLQLKKDEGLRQDYLMNPTAFGGQLGRPNPALRNEWVNAHPGMFDPAKQPAASVNPAVEKLRQLLPTLGQPQMQSAAPQESGISGLMEPTNNSVEDVMNRFNPPPLEGQEFGSAIPKKKKPVYSKTGRRGQ